MIEQLPFILHLSEEHLALLENKKPWSGSQWSDDDFKNVIKPLIRTQLESNQKCCAYCGLPFKGSKDMQIEHIAPKAPYRQPEFTFTLKNLVLSCGYCNDLIVKGAKETIEKPACETYEDCRFLLVHPYLDDPDEHYDWIEDEKSNQVVIQIKNDSSKAIFAIEMFDLASQGMSELRACNAFRKRRHTEMPNTTADERCVQLVLDFKQ